MSSRMINQEEMEALIRDTAAALCQSIACYNNRYGEKDLIAYSISVATLKGGCAMSLLEGDSHPELLARLLHAQTETVRKAIN